MAKKFAEITGIHKIFDTITIAEGPNAGTTIYKEMSIIDSELQKNIDENTIVFVTADDTDVDRIIGPNNYKISKDDCFIVTQNKVYATFGKVNVSDVMGPTGPAGTDASMPIGSIMMFAGNTAPEGWVFCRGQQILVVSATNTCTDKYKDFQVLASMIGSRYGTTTSGGTDVFGEFAPDLLSGSGTHYIKLPDFSARFPYGATNNNVLGNTGGTSEVTLEMKHIPYHTHGVLIPDVNSSSGSGVGANDTDGSNFGSSDDYYTNSMDDYNSSKTTESFDIIPPYLYINFIIKYQ